MGAGVTSNKFIIAHIRAANASCACHKNLMKCEDGQPMRPMSSDKHRWTVAGVFLLQRRGGRTQHLTRFHWFIPLDHSFGSFRWIFCVASHVFPQSTPINSVSFRFTLQPMPTHVFCVHFIDYIMQCARLPDEKPDEHSDGKSYWSRNGQLKNILIWISQLPTT